MTRSEQATQGTAALAELFESHYERITRYIAVRIGNRQDAEELASDVYVRALERLDTFQWRGIPMQAWLFRIAHNITVDHLRRNSRGRTTPLDNALNFPSSDDPEKEAIQTIEKERVVKAMESLTAAQREVVTLRFFGGLTSLEVAQVMKRSHGAVRELQSNALRSLRRLLPSAGVGMQG